MKKRLWIPLIILLFLAITYFTGPEPPDPEYSASWPDVPSKISALEEYISQKEDTMSLRADNEARILWNDSTKKVTDYSFIYLHGFAGSYRDGFPVNVQVADIFDANIYLARWAGHGLQPAEAMRNFTASTAWESAKEALAIGRQIGKKVIIMSTSTGGTLAIKLAATFPDSVHALINISPNIWDDQEGTFLLNMRWGYELAYLVSMGEYRQIEHDQEEAEQYWDTVYPAEALVQLQVLVESNMQPETYKKVTCPVLTLYYHKNFLEKDEHVEVDEFPEVHEGFSTPDSLLRLIALKEPETHFIGSSIKSKNYMVARKEIIQFCQEKLGMKTGQTSSSTKH